MQYSSLDPCFLFECGWSCCPHIVYAALYSAYINPVTLSSSEIDVKSQGLDQGRLEQDIDSDRRTAINGQL